ncbi:hypothetical protein MSAN_00130700 [Mycena sanguinolenta]|uniref:F-box domain-containing protein n=1 Tax=Mycena sanguinolenta TaxID=230812 RepID=A0A8H6ZG45_9AGAR|nr:hypothetical protein MSAN_00130700 [Mycena sanguinolenta]
MHHALEILEILERILYHLYDNGYYVRRDFAALACTCKAFQEPALDLVWHFRISLRKFLRLFPEDAFLRGDKRAWAQVMRPLRPLVAADFERFSFYANRVRYFAFSDENIQHLDEIFEALAPCLPTGCLFPNLRRLNFTHPEVWRIRFFISGKLIEISTKPCTGLAFMNPVAPMLERLSIRTESRWHQWVDEDTPAVSALIQQTRQLSYLSTRTLPWDALVHLSNLFSLRQLVVDELPVDTRAMNRLGPFTSLENLEFEKAPTSSLLHFLQPQSCRLTLKVFHIGLLDNIAAGSGPIYDAIADYLDNTSVCDIRLTMGSYHPVERIQTVSSAALLRLHVFSNLISLELHADRRIFLTEELIETLTRAWPRLELLRLITEKAPENPIDQTTPLPLRALQQFAKHSRHLRILELMFDSTTPPSLAEYEDVSQATLADLGISFSPMSDRNKASVAAYIFHLFPNIARLYSKANTMLRILPDPNDRHRLTVRWYSPDGSGWVGVAGHLQLLYQAK